MFVFFFQAEDGIRDLTVTGVQTCALPISVEQRLLAPGRNHDLAGQYIVHFQTRARAPGNGLTQWQDSFDERVSSRARVKRALRALADEARCREIGLARAEVDDRAARGAE